MIHIGKLSVSTVQRVNDKQEAASPSLSLSNLGLLNNPRKNAPHVWILSLESRKFFQTNHPRTLSKSLALNFMSILQFSYLNVPCSFLLIPLLSNKRHIPVCEWHLHVLLWMLSFVLVWGLQKRNEWQQMSCRDWWVNHAKFQGNCN